MHLSDSELVQLSLIGNVRLKFATTIYGQLCNKI